MVEAQDNEVDRVNENKNLLYSLLIMPLHKNERNLYFIRHGESESNVLPEFAAGHNDDAPLTKLGEKQAKALGERLKEEKIQFDFVFTSQLVRATKTAKIMLKHSNNNIVSTKKSKKLNELEIPSWRGKKRRKVLTAEVEASWGKNGKFYSPGDGESEYEVQKRFSSLIDEEIIFNDKISKINSNLNIAIVAHGNAFRCYFQHLLEFDQSFIKKMQIDNTSISEFRFDSNGWNLIRLNDSSHIKKLS